jgi:hypothetical protein
MFEQPFRQAAALGVVLWLLAPTAAAAGSPHYTVATDERLEHLNVSACFEGAVPRRLTARDEHAPDLLRAARLHTRDDVIELQLQGSTLSLPRSGAPACVQYRVDLRAISKRQWRSGNWRTRDAIVVDPALWLWYPDDVREDARWRLDVNTPLRKIVAGEPLENPWADAHPVQVAHLLEHSSGLLDITREEFDHNAPFSSLEAAFAWRPQARDTASLMGTGRDWTNLCVRGSGGTDTVVTAMAICPTSLTTVSPMRGTS